MRIFEKDGKVNFVDERDTFVGFDYSQGCCECFGWMLSWTRPTAFVDGANGIDPEGYYFDRSFFEDALPGVYTEDGGVAVFRLTDGTNEVFLTLWNSHNGYYGHGFEVKHGGEVVRSGCL